MDFLLIFSLFLPLIFLLWLANLADKRRMQERPRRDVAVLVYTLLALFWLVLFGAGVFLLLLGMAYQRYADISLLAESYRQQGLDPTVVVEMMRAFPKMGSGFILLAVTGLLTLLSPFRRLLARLLPISANSVVHLVALNYSVLILVNLWLVMGMGLETMLDMMKASSDTTMAGDMIRLLWAQDIALALMAFVGVGWLSRRRWSEAMRRLGLVWPSWKEAGVGFGLGLAMFALLFPASYLLEKIGLGMDPNIEQLTEELLGPLLTTLPGIFTLGVAAALGEELVYRGALQPRFGIFMTALLFALTHNQYGLSAATLVVFALGLVLGWVRAKYNTSTAMILHATYNIAIGLTGLIAGRMLH